MRRARIKRKARRNGNGWVVGFHRGRDSSKVQELQDDFVHEFSEGATDADACSSIGCSESLYRRWMQLGKLYEEALVAEAEGEEEDVRNEKHYRFRRAVLKAKASYRKVMRESINDAVKPGMHDTKHGWLALEVLARRDSSNWGRDQAPERRPGDYIPDETFL